MASPRPRLPKGHGEVLIEPPFEQWGELARANATAADAWRFEVAGRDARVLRQEARREALTLAADFSSRLGVPVREPGPHTSPIVLTGHQPQLYHPGVWIKDFLVQRASDEHGMTAVDLVVDTDAFERIELLVPCLLPEARRCRVVLAEGGLESCYACAPVPSPERIQEFREAGIRLLRDLPGRAVVRHFMDFCDGLDDSVSEARNLAEFMTIARRRYESSAGTDYLELCLSSLSGGAAFTAFAADIVSRGEEFATAHNEELAAYRTANGIRTRAQPFPDLATSSSGVELPLWALGGHGRRTLSARRAGGNVALLADGQELLVSSPDPVSIIEGLTRAGIALAPKAVALTMFSRLFIADLFVHGVGGGRYDLVTDGVVRRFYGVEPPAYAIASMTMYLPLGGRIVTDAEVAETRRRLQRLEHNPDEFLAAAELDESARMQARRLAEEKARLVRDIAVPGADKRAISSRIREVNAALREMVASVADEMAEEAERLERERAAIEVLTDRTYAYCLWSPLEVRDQAH